MQLAEVVPQPPVRDVRCRCCAEHVIQNASGCRDDVHPLDRIRTQGAKAPQELGVVVLSLRAELDGYLRDCPARERLPAPGEDGQVTERRCDRGGDVAHESGGQRKRCVQLCCQGREPTATNEP